MEPEETAESAESCMAEILHILGWQFACTGSKAPHFATSFDVLGVSVDLTKFIRNYNILKHKTKRVESLSATLDKLVCYGKVEAGVAASLHGQLNFPQGH